MGKKKTVLVERLCDAVRPPSEIEPWRWGERFVVVPTSAAGQKWSSEDAVFLREIMEAFADESVNEIYIMCAAQSAKTLTIMVLLAWALAEDPGPILWVTASKVEAKKLSKGRLLPLLERCAPVAAKLPKDRDRKTTLEVYFPGAPLVLTGAESDASLQGTPYRYLFLDEVRSYPAGALEMVSNRTRSYTHNHKNALMPWWASWAQQVKEFLSARAALKWNDWHPLKDWVNETCGEPWTDRRRYEHDERFIAAREEDFDPTAPWPEETRRFATIDVQGKGGRHFYLVIRAWATGGRSRKLWHEKLWSLDDVRARIKEWNVQPENVGIDSGFYASEVYGYVVSSGYAWKPMKGDDKPFYRINGVNFIYTWTLADPAIGTSQQGRVRPVRLLIFSKPSTLDRLSLFMHGQAGDWRIHHSTDVVYRTQATAYELRERVNPKGVVSMEWHQKRPDDHYASCEIMQIACAAATDLLSAPREGDLFSQPANS